MAFNSTHSKRSTKWVSVDKEKQAKFLEIPEDSGIEKKTRHSISLEKQAKYLADSKADRKLRLGAQAKYLADSKEDRKLRLEAQAKCLRPAIRVVEGGYPCCEDH